MSENTVATAEDSIQEISASTYCVFDKWPDGSCHCVRGKCGRVYPKKGMPIDPNVDCSKIVAVCKGGRPGIIKRAENIAKAAPDIIAGKRVDEEALHRRFTICQGCKLYQPVDGTKGFCTHMDCGCNVAATDNYLNKAALENQLCPFPQHNKWRMADEELKAIGHPDRIVTTT